MSAPRPCANCGKHAVEHWVRPDAGAMYCERTGSENKYDRGTLTPDDQVRSDRFESALRAVVAILARSRPCP